MPDLRLRSVSKANLNSFPLHVYSGRKRKPTTSLACMFPHRLGALDSERQHLGALAGPAPHSTLASLQYS